MKHLKGQQSLFINPCKNLSAIGAQFRLIAPTIAMQWLQSRRDISDRDAIEVNRACNSDAMIAIAAKL